MLRLLLDEHLSPALAAQLRHHRPEIEVVALRDFEGGAYLGASDEVMLQVAASSRLTLLTYDLRTIPPLLRRWSETGTPHAGVIFVDQKSIDPTDIGNLIRAICQAVETLGDIDWSNQVIYLSRA